MSDLKRRISDLAGLMEEFRLAEAELESNGERIAFRRRPLRVAGSPHLVEASETGHEEHVFPVAPDPIPAGPQGVAVTSPMTGIFYISPSPNAPPFVRVGEPVAAGQVVGLIEAMKVFNEIVSATNGTVLSIVSETGQLVQPGDPLMFVG